MKYVTIEIEDNSARLCEMNKQYQETMQRHDLLGKEINSLQTEALLKMLFYIRCAYQDYTKIYPTGMEVFIRGVEVRVTSDYIKITVRDRFTMGHFIHANIMKDGVITIVDRTQEGIAELMQKWPAIKKALQEAIDSGIKTKVEAANIKVKADETLLRIAQEFEL